MLGGYGTEGLRRVGGVVDFGLGALALGRGIAVARRVGIADKFDLAGAGRRRRQRQADLIETIAVKLGNVYLPQRHGCALRFIGQFYANCVQAGLVRHHGDIDAALLPDRLAVDINIVGVVLVGEDDHCLVALESAFVIEPRPLVAAVGADTADDVQRHGAFGVCRACCLGVAHHQGDCDHCQGSGK